MNPVIVRNVAIGEGRPKICVPIVGKTADEIIMEARSLRSVPVDVVEWRVDWFEDVFDAEKLSDTAEALRKTLGDLPVLFTFRTAEEGGEKAVSDRQYEAINRAAAQSGCVDLMDVEICTRDEVAGSIITAAHNCNIRVIGSNHDFHRTPPKEEIIKRLSKMQQSGADILKIALMPQSKQDVLTVLAATLEMSEQHTDRPLITMSMAGTGVISRLAGEVFGSAITFGAASKTSAPGQIGVRQLADVLDIIHNNL